jgi:hypothetical protein
MPLPEAPKSLLTPLDGILPADVAIAPNRLTISLLTEPCTAYDFYHFGLRLQFISAKYMGERQWG